MVKYYEIPNEIATSLHILQLVNKHRTVSTSTIKQWKNGQYQTVFKLVGTRKNLKRLIKNLNNEL
ncbi:hypothetical protein OAE13_07045 [Flavobacteriaceae bacterium]|jgi:hypothetical protein|nr:hypothetical protein [Flavobacteriaceae bacterium]